MSMSTRDNNNYEAMHLHLPSITTVRGVELPLLLLTGAAEGPDVVFNITTSYSQEVVVSGSLTIHQTLS